MKRRSYSLLPCSLVKLGTEVMTKDFATIMAYSSKTFEKSLNTLFIENFREVFKYPAGGQETGVQLQHLKQGEQTAAEYALTFHTLASQRQCIEKE